jgi:metal-responsive CopG/Arc/MetJ family transcriptional regulator
MSSKSTRVLISIPEALLEMLDAKADSVEKSRSEFIRDAVRNYIKNGDHLTIEKETGKDESNSTPSAE